MNKPEFIGPALGSTTDSGTSRPPVRQMPHDLLRQASRRLGILCLLAAFLWISATMLYHLGVLLVPKAGVNWYTLTLSDGICVFAIMTSLALYWYAMGKNRDPQFILDLGLVQLIGTAIDLSVILHLDEQWLSVPPMPTITWVGVIILIFPAIAPNSPGKTLVAGLIAASINPLALLYVRSQGHWEGPLGGIFFKHFPDYLLVAVSVVISKVMTGLGRQVMKARELGSYRLESMLGKGGMGEVWRATHRMLARDAAIKLIDPQTLSRSSGENAGVMTRRFEQEAKATASLRSPHTVELYDFGVTEQGVFYYAMELLDGFDLQTLVARFGPQPPARTVSILVQVCRSLAEAHQRGMVHRDIKPTNIFLCRMGGEFDLVKVLDFGLVKVVDNADKHLTGEGSAMGTPAYMAPEIALGTPDVDGRTDLYSLGGVAYWLLTGRQLFQEPTAMATIMVHVQKTPPAPSKIGEFPITAALDKAILECLAKDPAARPATAEILARALEAGVTDHWTRDQARTWWETNAPGPITPVRLAPGAETTVSSVNLR